MGRDCLTIIVTEGSPWKAEDIRTALRINQVNWAVAQAERLGLAKVLYINMDDSLGEKDRDTRHLEPVDWFHDQSESTRRKPVFKNAFCYLAANLRIGKMVFTVDLRLYLREKTVRRLNRHRQAGQRIPFRSKNSLAKSILEALRPASARLRLLFSGKFFRSPYHAPILTHFYECL